MKKYLLLLLYLALYVGVDATSIDRKAVVSRNNPHLTAVDTLGALTVGNGHFAFTVDATGMQTFPQAYSKGMPLGTMSDWGWHSFPNTEGYKPEEALRVRDFGRGHEELYACEFREPGRQRDAANYLRQNPHRLHLGCLGLNLTDLSKVKDVDQTLELWNGLIDSRFNYNGQRYHVQTVCSPDAAEVGVRVESDGPVSLRFQVPYPTGKHSDDGCDWGVDRKHTVLVRYEKNCAHVKVSIDDTKYPVTIQWKGNVEPGKRMLHHGLTLWSDEGKMEAVIAYGKMNRGLRSFSECRKAASRFWNAYWKEGGIVDFSHVSDSRARELERRVVLSQYLLAVNDGGDTPPQETGLTYNSWFGKFHLEMIWWHQAQFALWGHPEILERSLLWFQTAAQMGREIARRQGFDGIRWMKMTSPDAAEAPSNVGSYLIWQQPHLIYLAELLYRCQTTDIGRQRIVDTFGSLVDETARFMYAFATYDPTANRYVLKGCIPAQETLKADSTVNPPMELSYWHLGLQMAQQWRERQGKARDNGWDRVISRLSPLAANADSLYLAAESAVNTYSDIRFTSDHPAVLGAVGMLPMSRLASENVMRNTLNWVMDHWNWDKTWGWDYPMVAMCAARMGEPETAVEALLMDRRTNTYLVNGHNYQDGRLRVYLPGNGGLLTAVGMMLAGWDGMNAHNPGFPKSWNVRWEGILPMP